MKSQTSYDEPEYASDEEFSKVLKIDDPNERSSALAKLHLSVDQTNAATVAARKDFL